MLIDTHTHINSDKFNDNYKEIIDRALNQDVKKMLVVGFDKSTNKRAIELAEKHDFLYATVGFHPTIASDIKEKDFEMLRQQLAHEKVVGVGECGLDFYWHKDNKETQITLFKQHIALSKEFNKPLIIHMRDASEATYNTLSEYEALSGVMHCYGGSVEMASMFLDLGLYISLGGPVTFKNAKTPKEVAKIIPLDKLLIETDSPYLSPHPFRGKTNEPARVKLIAEKIAELKDMSFKNISKHTTANATKLFNL
ncbi:MAG: TatD family hydrolase [Candidatus Izimaplasma sp.]|nr:TatD family hydrolase [Candidatus Izimaplasma bacterium]